MPNGTERHAGVRVDVVELCVRKVEHGSGIKRDSLCDVDQESRSLSRAVSFGGASLGVSSLNVVRTNEAETGATSMTILVAEPREC